MRDWKFIIFAISVCLLATVAYVSTTDNSTRIRALVEKSTYHKETGLLEFTVKFEDSKGNLQRLELTKQYPKGSDAPLMHTMEEYYASISYNEEKIWKTTLYKPSFPWKLLFMFIGCLLFIWIPKAYGIYLIRKAIR